MILNFCTSRCLLLSEKTSSGLSAIDWRRLGKIHLKSKALISCKTDAIAALEYSIHNQPVKQLPGDRATANIASTKNAMLAAPGASVLAIGYHLNPATSYRA